VRARRSGKAVCLEHAEHPHLEIIQEEPRAPLWGQPFF
jgi:hypothetical protein